MQLARRKLLSGAVAAAAVGGASYWAYGSAGAASSQVPAPKSLGTLSSDSNFVSGAGVAFSPDGREMAVLAGTSVQRWDTASWNELPALLAGTGLIAPQAFAYGPDGDCIAIGYGTSLVLADRRDGSLLQSVSMTSAGGGQGAVSTGQVAFSPDNRYLAVLTVVVGAAEISVYPYSRGRVGETPAVRLTLDSSEPVGPMGFSAASSKLYASGAGVTFWDLGSWNRGQLPAGTSATGQQPSEFSFMALSQDGRFIAGGSDLVVIWDTTSGRVVDIVNDVPDGGGVGAFASDSSLVIGGQSGDLSLWDFADRKTLAAWSVGNPPLVSIAVSPTGGVVAIGCEGTCSIWNLPAHVA